MKTLILFDGTIHAKIALSYSIHLLKPPQDKLYILKVWNKKILPYYDSLPNVERLIERDWKGHLEEVKRIVKEQGQGIRAYIIEEEGELNEVLDKNIKAEGIDLVFAPSNYRGMIKTKTYPLVFLPGTLMVPIDHEGLSICSLELLIKEATLAVSDVLVFGIVPIHIYSATEQKELQEITEKTKEAVKNVAKRLSKSKIKTKQLLCSGYPDEEILKATKQNPVSIILLAEFNQRASEINKAINLVLQDGDFNIPVFAVHCDEDRHLTLLKRRP